MIYALDESGLLSSKLWDLGTSGIEETPAGLCAYFEDDIRPDSIRGEFPEFTLRVQMNLAPPPAEQASALDPVFAGSRFVIVPVTQAKLQRRLTPGRIVLPVDAGMAFGSGRHETTQLCLEALEMLVEPRYVVFDVGCGSGILALAAHELGAAQVVAADIDELAVAVARRHFSGSLFVGSADCLATNAADLVICNITGSVDDLLAADLQRILKPSGHLILSGFTIETAPQRFQPGRILNQGDWQCWICPHSSINPDVNAAAPTSHNPRWWLES